MSEFVGEGLEDPGEGVAPRSAHSIGGHAERHERGAEEKVRQESSGKFIAGDVGGGSKLLAFTKADEMIAPGDEVAGRIDAALEKMKTGGAIVIVVKIILASPQELDGNADLLGDGGSFEHVLRWRRNSATSVDATLAALVAGASKLSPALSPDAA